MNAPTLIPPLWLFLGAAPALLGLVLLYRGLRPRRLGANPHCARCDYSLLGNASGVCPECGADLADPSATVLGQRHRRPGLALVGAFVLLLGLAFSLLPAARSYDWYRLKPAAWVLDDLERGGTNASRASGELQRRYKIGALSPDHRSRLADLALIEQGRPTPTPFASPLTDFLGLACSKGELSESQKQQFFSQMVRLTLRVRPTVRLGDPIPYLIEETMRGPTGGSWSVQLQTTAVFLDGVKVRDGGGGLSGFSGFGGGGSTGSSLPCNTPGRHTVTVRQSFSIFQGPTTGLNGPAGDPQPPPVHQASIDLSATTDVLAPDQAPPVRLSEGPEVAEQIRAALRPLNFSVNFGKASPDRLNGQIKIAPRSVGIAFEVFARIDGREYPMGNISQVAAQGTTYHVQSQGKLPRVPHRFDLVLRSSERVARGNVDLADMFNGELVYEDVPVQAGPSNTAIPTSLPTN